MTLTLNQIIRSAKSAHSVQSVRPTYYAQQLDSITRRASITVFTCLMAVFIERTIPSTGEAVSLIVLTAGKQLHC